MQNYLKEQTSPYLLQHADNPVHWYPWCEEAFRRAKAEDKPIFLSIGYSTCHWCHVMAHESFEDEEIAQILNQHYIAIKVDKEERPDIDSIYMAVCQAFTGSGGWPTTIFMTPEQKPFFAGTYFPKTAGYGRIGLKELLLTIQEKWKTDKTHLLKSAEEVITALKQSSKTKGEINPQLVEKGFQQYKASFDAQYGGFGDAPKFPTPHNLLFLLQYYEKNNDEDALHMAEKTLMQMYLGGIFDHIGGGFCRYSTDRYFLVPHFEKMLYDNALLILAYVKAYQLTKKHIYCEIAEKTAGYILREMTSLEGGFYSAQDADSEGEEGRFYLFRPSEIKEILGEKLGTAFNQYFDITEKGNFEGRNIPNLLKTHTIKVDFDSCMPKIYVYRKNRYALHLDDKILTSWNALMITAMCHLYRVTANKKYLEAAVKAQKFIEENLCEKDTLFVSFRAGRHSGKGFLDDYSHEMFALLALYEATLDTSYLDKMERFCDKVIADFGSENGFFFYGKENEQLIIRPKETYDGAVFSGNSAMAYNLVRLHLLKGEAFAEKAKKQLDFMSDEAKHYPAGYAMFLMALSDYMDMPTKITVVLKNKAELAELPCKMPINSILHIFEEPMKEYPLKNDKTTFYVCKNHSCMPPINEFPID